MLPVKSCIAQMFRILENWSKGFRLIDLAFVRGYHVDEMVVTGSAMG